jgi:hypothetical protein
MPTQKQPSDFSSREKRWRVVLNNWGEETFFDEEEYEGYKKAISEGKLLYGCKDGRIVSTKPVLVEQNKFWIDPKKAQFFKVKRKLIDEYQELKEQGTFTRFEDYIEWKKQQLTAKKKNE